MYCQHGIIGGGCAGLQMLNALLQNPATQNDSMVIFEPEVEIPDKSWCFWSKEEHTYQDLVEKSWDQLVFRAKNKVIKRTIFPYKYQYISSQKFYHHHRQLLSQHRNVKLLNAKVSQVTSQNGLFVVECDEGRFQFENIYDSRQNAQNNEQPQVWQHFLGWHVIMAEPVFDTSAATIMDFDVPGNGFIYLLPFSSCHALVEFTYFSLTLYQSEHYRFYLQEFMAERYPQTAFLIKNAECGKIPMSGKSFTGIGEAGQWLIGTTGGMTKATTGYTFTRIMNDCERIAKAVAKGKSAIPNRGTTGRFLFYDRLLLGILERKPDLLEKIMYKLFSKQPFQRILSFLDESSSLTNEIKIFGTLPWKPFLTELFHYRKNL